MSFPGRVRVRKEGDTDVSCLIVSQTFDLRTACEFLSLSRQNLSLRKILTKDDGFSRCAKCHNLVDHDTNLLLLSDGSPVCENCSYICSVCTKPIHNEAIVTGPHLVLYNLLEVS